MNGDKHLPKSDAEMMENLMVLDALGETTPEQKLRLNNALAKDAALSARHATLTSQARQMRAVFDAQVDHTAAGGEAPPIPANVLARLESARREALANQRGQAEALAKIVAFPSSNLKPQASSRTVLPTWFARAAVIALLGIVTGYWFLHEKYPPVASPALAPRGATGLTEPLIVWENKPDQKYDVWILPPEGSQTEAPALYTAKNVRSPIAFSNLKPTDAAKGQKELQPGKPYRLLVCFASLGRLAGVTVPFQTTAEAEGQLHVPSDVQAVLLKARRLIESGKPGDALMVLTTLQESERTTAEVVELSAQARKKLPAPAGHPKG